jgi:hypothetical protein
MFGGFPFQEMHSLFHSMDWGPMFPILQTMRTVLCGIAGDVNIGDVLHCNNSAMDAFDSVQRRQRELDQLWLFVLDFFSDIVQNPARKPRVCVWYCIQKSSRLGKAQLYRGCAERWQVGILTQWTTRTTFWVILRASSQSILCWQWTSPNGAVFPMRTAGN